jgi:hypothetical protein
VLNQRKWLALKIVTEWHHSCPAKKARDILDAQETAELSIVAAMPVRKESPLVRGDAH